MTEAQIEAIAKIKYIAADKRGRVFLEDHCKWLETKLKEINKLARTFPEVKAWKPSKEVAR